MNFNVDFSPLRTWKSAILGQFERDKKNKMHFTKSFKTNENLWVMSYYHQHLVLQLNLKHFYKYKVLQKLLIQLYRWSWKKAFWSWMFRESMPCHYQQNLVKREFWNQLKFKNSKIKLRSTNPTKVVSECWKKFQIHVIPFF